MNRIKELRQSRGMSQSDLAAVLSVSTASVSGYEIEKYQADIKTYKKIAEYFEVTIDYLLGGQDAPKEEKSIMPMFPDAIAKYGKLDEIDRMKVLAYMDGMLAAEKYSAASARAVG